MKKILVISFTDLSKDPRVNRQIEFIKDEYEVTAIGTKDPNIKGVKYIDCGRVTRTKKEKLKDIFKLLSRNYEAYYWSAPHIKASIEKLKEANFDIIIANDMDSLPLALRIKKDAKLVFDAHEYAPREFEDLLIWRVLYQSYKEYLCKKYINRADAMMTVCQGIADEYKQVFGVNPIIITNAPGYYNISPGLVDDNNIRIVYHGGANPSRKIENMIDMMDYLDKRFTLDLILIGSDKYLDFLRKRAEHNPNIRFLPPVPMKMIVENISNYDIGVYLLEPNSFNNKMALPNKFFEYIQGRLVIAIGPSPQMQEITEKYQCGIVSESFMPQSLAKAINLLEKEKISFYKKQSDKLAAIICAENNKKLLLNMLKNLY